ncbi:MAG: carbohydrate-binding family 9-like protein [Thermodesulfovibrionales bacterium]
MYRVRFHACGPALEGKWDSPQWSSADTLELLHFRTEGSSHRPRTAVKLCYSDAGISGIFRVDDRYVRCMRTAYMEPVYKDSCVEFFVRPRPGSGYFNFEFNCGGALLCSYITNPERTADGFKQFTPLPVEDGRQVRVYHSLLEIGSEIGLEIGSEIGPKTVFPEISEPVTWVLEFFIPFALLEKYTGSIGDLPGQEWAANFFKCGDETSHPHWVSWQPLHSLNFHLPECFGKIRFEGK